MGGIGVMIEVKGRKRDVIKWDKNGDICKVNKDKEGDYGNIGKYGVNGGVDYGDGILKNRE